MKKAFFIISIVILLCVTYLIIVNVSNYQPIHYNFSNTGENGTSTYLSTIMSIALYTGIILFAGIFSGAGVVYLFLSEANTKIKAYERELEKSSITGENNASKVEVFEAKIQTLEKAFNTVIDERTKLEIQIKSLNSELDKLNKNNG